MIDTNNQYRITVTMQQDIYNTDDYRPLYTDTLTAAVLVYPEDNLHDIMKRMTEHLLQQTTHSGLTVARD